MGIYTDGKPRLGLFEAIKKILAKIREEDAWEKKLKEGYGKGIKKKEE